MPRKYNEKLHKRNHNGTFAKKGTGVLLSPKSGKSRSYSSRNHSTVAGGAKSFAAHTNKTGGGKTRAGKSSSNLGRNVAIGGAVLAAGALAAYSSHKYVTSVAGGGPIKGLHSVNFKNPIGNIKVGPVRIHGAGGRFLKQSSKFPRST